MNKRAHYDFQGGINTIMDFCKRINGYVTETEPWKIAKDESRKAELDAILKYSRRGFADRSTSASQ
jgi:methionyl-tRNA synthetase